MLALLHGREPSPQTGALLAVLDASDLLKHVVDRPDRKAAKARAKQIAEGNWASAGVRKAIEASQAAITAAVVASTVAASSSGGS